MKPYKIVLIGDEAVGKTALIHKFLEEDRDIVDYKPTIGVEIHKKFIKDEKNPDNDMVMYLWDMAGQEKFMETRRIYYEGANGILVIFDCTRPRTFKNVRNWFEEARESSDIKTPMILISNKQDLKKFRKITHDETEKLANDLNIEYIETSALTGENVKEIFVNLVKGT